MPDVRAFEFALDADVRGKGRPRFGRGRTFTDPATVAAEELVWARWQEVGRPRIIGALTVRLEFTLARPNGHYKIRGGLSAIGRRFDYATVKPDLDNAAKLVLDALNGRAWRDDADIVELYVTKQWGSKDVTYIRASALAPVA